MEEILIFSTFEKEGPWAWGSFMDRICRVVKNKANSI